MFSLAENKFGGYNGMKYTRSTQNSNVIWDEHCFWGGIRTLKFVPFPFSSFFLDLIDSSIIANSSSPQKWPRGKWNVPKRRHTKMLWMVMHVNIACQVYTPLPVISTEVVHQTGLQFSISSKSFLQSTFVIFLVQRTVYPNEWQKGVREKQHWGFSMMVSG